MNSHPPTTPKKTLLFVVDVKGWAFYHIVLALVENLREKYDCYICYVADYKIVAIPRGTAFMFIKHNLKTALRFFFFKYIKKKEYRGNFMHPSLRYTVPVQTRQKIESLAGENQNIPSSFDFRIDMDYDYPFLARLPFKSQKRLVGIYTESYPHGGSTVDIVANKPLADLSRDEFFEQYLKPYNGLLVGSLNLLATYGHYLDNIALVNGVYLQNSFVGRPKTSAGPLTLGWTGNPNREFKGYYSILIPAIERVRETGRNIFLKTKFSGPYEDLLTFYTDVDVVVIASDADTGPSMFAEAALSHVPAISTRVGFPAMVIRDGVNGLFVERSIDAFVQAIIKLYDDRTLLHNMSSVIKDDYLKVLGNEKLAKNLTSLLERL